MPCPNYQERVEQLKNENPTAWKNAHTGNEHTEDFVRIVAWDLFQTDPRVALNGKRGNPADISDDALNILDPEDGPGTTPEGHRCWVVDFIYAAGSPEAAVTWQPIPDPAGSSGARVVPGPPPASSDPQPYPSEDPDGGWWGQVFDVQVAATYAEANRVYPDPADPKSLRWCGRCAYDIHAGLTKEASLAKHLKDLRAALGLP